MEEELRNSQLPWGKTDLSGMSAARGGPSWDPLLAHLLDVAAVTMRLWDVYLPKPMRVRLAEAFGGGDESVARAVVAFLAALHDLGKASDCFQHLFGTGRGARPGLVEGRAEWERIVHAHGFPLAHAADLAAGARHEHVTAAVLPRLLGCRCPDCGGNEQPVRGLHIVAMLLGGHHGHIPPKDTVDRAAAAVSPQLLREVHPLLLTDLAEQLEVDLEALPHVVRPTRPSTFPVFAGLVVLADWVASTETLFTYRRLGPISSWWASSRAEAVAACDRLHLNRWEPNPVQWADIWPATMPRPFQSAVVDHVPSEGQILAIIESDTGSGKTRGALWCAHRLIRTRGYTGVYQAVPTRAATNQAAREMRSFLGTALGRDGIANLAVVHGAAAAATIVHELLDAGAAEQSELDAIREAAAASIEAGNDLDGHVVLDPWFLRRCLGLISPFGVGTVDQVVLSAQPSRHWFLRMFGLACKIIIIDEAHAYELFQQHLLQAALSWFADAGASVIVLSATLPRNVRSELTEAWCRGLGTAPVDAGESGPITIVDQHGSVRRIAPPVPHPLHTTICLEEDPGHVALAHRLLSEIRSGGIVAVIRNRVQQAHDLYTEVRALAENEGWEPDEIVILHAGMLPRIRQQIEAEITEQVGAVPGGGPNPLRPQRLIVIATQVVEQSLDLDFDWIVTDLAPIDLLIQRRGRLHRHSVNDPLRPPRFRAPQMTVLHRTRNGLPVVGKPSRNRPDDETNADAWVYAPFVLAATWKTLSDRIGRGTCGTCGVHPGGNSTLHIVTPADSGALIESVYGPLSPAGGSIGELIETTRHEWEVELQEEYMQAEHLAVAPYTRRGRPTGIENLASGSAHGSGDNGGAQGIRARSRLGEETVPVVVVFRRSDGGLAYDSTGTLPLDFRRYRGDLTPAEVDVARRQQYDIMSNTIAVPVRWFSRGRIPATKTWPPLGRGPFGRLDVLVVDADGRCEGLPERLRYSDTRGLSISR
ncbi:CRISPR-associated helicase Cas3' [Nocardia higoensis]|uniref:CRISPR-associated helicase Cas3 n=1 Tax=Nocardia higoensis TaxID=228599 RepID=A0ABS0DEY7_9NOCA|nr:CRISPR-associated helicase Cas3' [Nocardia higoensis]MBF6357026.1 CRISPR-associated helicase Cas3' [Nocardia higoensis]